MEDIKERGGSNKNMIVLKIDTSKQEEIEIALIINDNLRSIKGKFSKGSQVVLPFIKKLLDENKLSLKQIDGILVNTGPGSFTGLRVGISVANALGYALKIPVNRKKAGETIEPIYK